MKHFFKDYFWVLSLGAVLLMGCSTEQEIVDSDNGGTTKGKITFSFPMLRETTTYATVAATGDESLISAAKMKIFMVNGLDVVEKIFSGGAITFAGSGSTQSATISFSGEVTSAKKFYFVANSDSVSNLSSIVEGTSTVTDLLNLTTVTQKDKPLSSSGGVLMTGSVTVQPDELTIAPPAPIKVTLKRRIARFDISNDSTVTNISIKSIHFTNGHKTAYAFSDKSVLPTVKGSLPDVIFSRSTYPTANKGESKSVFYLYPSDVVSIQLLARRNADGAERLYNIALPKEGIQANKSYTIKTIVSNTAPFELAVENWDGYGDVGISSANPLKIVSSTVTSGRKASWNGSTLRFDVSASLDTTRINFDITTLTSMGIDMEVIGATAECNIIATKSAVGIPTQTGTETLSYPQTATITIPPYTGLVPFEAKVLIKDAYDQSQCRIVTISREDYYPAAHKGWAGCNIYWDGSKLTFDDTNNRTNEQRQGVYFQWGSLWGISPMDNWSVGTTTLYSPAGTTTTATAEGFTWSTIPRIPNGLYVPAAPADEAMYRNWAYAYQVTDSASGIGDICKYLTDKGWAPAGKKWRMPTSREFEAEADYNSFGSFDTQTPDKADGKFEINGGYRKGTNATDPFFPASGHRYYSTGALYNVGTHGCAWSGSPYSTESNGYYLYFYSSTVTPAYNNSRANGFPVRCVAE